MLEMFMSPSSQAQRPVSHLQFGFHLDQTTQKVSVNLFLLVVEQSCSGTALNETLSYGDTNESNHLCLGWNWIMAASLLVFVPP